MRRLLVPSGGEIKSGSTATLWGSCPRSLDGNHRQPVHSPNNWPLLEDTVPKNSLFRDLKMSSGWGLLDNPSFHGSMDGGGACSSLPRPGWLSIPSQGALQRSRA